MSIMIRTSCMLLVVMMFQGSLSAQKNWVLRKQNLEVRFYHDKPVFNRIIFKNDTLTTPVGRGILINNRQTEWTDWRIHSIKKSDTLVYKLSSKNDIIKAEFVFWLDASTVHFKIRNVQDPTDSLREIGLYEQPWVSIADTGYRWWIVRNWTRVPFVPTIEPSRGIGFYAALSGRVGDPMPLKKNDILTYASVWHPRKFCLGLKTNMSLYPVKASTDGGSCTLAPNIYYYKVKRKRMPDYEAQLSFVDDINANKTIDVGDYLLWCNRQIKDANELHRGSIWYKIFLNDVHNKTNPCTTLAEAREIIRYINNITDGIPQIIYLVGWQYSGHDTGYPALDELNPAMGSREELYNLSAYCDSIGGLLSIHANIDDAYKGNKYFSENIMATDFDGSAMFWEKFADSAYHISHYKDVQTGSIFKRLEQLMKIFPLKKSIQFDALRVTNTNPAWEKEGIGVLEEYELGLKPIAEWLRKRNILITLETQNGNPVDLSPVVVGSWTNFWAVPAYRQIYHRKIVAGGIPKSMAPLRYTSGMGNSITEDLSYRPYADKSPFLGDGQTNIKQVMYLSAILYQFYLTKEMLESDIHDSGYQVRFSDGVSAVYDKKTDELLVKWKDVIIAHNDDRFIPIHGGIYAFSKDGTTSEWLLPEEYRNSNLRVYELSADGRHPFSNYRIVNDRIKLRLAANQAVKIVKVLGR